MGALTLTGLIPTIYEAMDVVSREKIGFITAVSQDFSAERAALNQTISSPVVGAMVAEDLTPSPFAQDTPNQSIGKVDMTISKSRSVPFGITGEETKGLQSAGTLVQINRDRIAQAIRTLSNEMEVDLYTELYKSASRSYGTAGTTPFGTASDFSDFAGMNEILDENGAPDSDRHLVLGSAAIRNIRGKQAVLFKANEAGTEDLLRRGIIGQVEGLDIHQSAAIKGTVAVGTGASATTNTAGYAVGATVITLAAAGTGAILAGDFVQFAGDSRKYLLDAGNANVSAGGTITLSEPGLLQAIPPSATAVTVVAAATRNIAFHRTAIQLATRAPAMPEGGDCADDVMMVTDPITKITYEFALYRQKRQVRYEVNLAWGKKLIAKRHSGILLG
ncbi:P22 phage major capsid protein family protein [Duganella callida]|uniref:P22 coat-protein 5 family protein n=1 Tax=Duganella callida TaxID=2561932 RepID=A0A4Y9S3R3_9BURK|nr:P22 phage major capsid protein family protein [Duganella callida]TFW15960.1 P22 coat - protein 5 family protein [Duganella callida]